VILRSLSKHVEDQNWFAVGLDFFIVVVGVFIGIQVSNWNAARIQEQAADSYIERIREDLAANVDDMSQRTAYFNQVRSNALNALSALDQPPETLGGQFLIGIYQASQYMPRSFARDTYDEILSVGANNAISDIEVRKRLANFYRSIVANLFNLQNVVPYREIVREHMPYPAQAAIRANCDDVLTTGDGGEPIVALPERCNIDLSPDIVSEAVAAIIQQDVMSALVRRLSELDLYLIATNLIIARANALDAYLAEVNK